MAIVEDQELLQMFLEESREHLDGIESNFLEIEEMGEDVDSELVNNVFRAIHSVKGGAGFLGLDVIKDLAHTMENVLNLIRNHQLIPTPEIISVLLASLDQLKDLIQDYANSNEADISNHVNALNEAVASQSAPAASSPSPQSATPEPPEEAPAPDAEQTQSEPPAEGAALAELRLPDGRVLFTAQASALSEARKGGRTLYVAMFDWVKDVDDKKRSVEQVVTDIKAAGVFLDSKLDMAEIPELEDIREPLFVPFYVLFSTVLEPDFVPTLLGIPKTQIFLVSENHQLKLLQEPQADKPSVPPAPAAEPPAAEVAKAPAEETREAAAPPAPPAAPARQKQKKAPKPKTVSTKSSTLRVHVNILDRLMNLAGELVLTRNQLLQNFSSNDQKGMESAVQRVDLITSELQEAIMSTRMQPIGMVFNKFQRLVHDMSKNLGKQVTLVTEGEEVELDKTIIEAIGDPLTHLVRNSMDHGIEMPEERARAGKKLPATVKLSAKHEAGQVIIQVADDGAGINPQKIREKALQLKLADKAELDAMPDNEVIRFIFKPGFSTAEVVTDVSGRGVGMDVVFSNLSKLGGSVEIDSRLGAGTTVLIKLPLTLAIIPSLIIGVQGSRFALPQVNLVELVRIPAAQVKERIERIDDAAVLRLRGELLPLIRVADALQMQRKIRDPQTNEVYTDRRQTIFDRRSPELGKDDQPTEAEIQEKRRRAVDRRQNIQSAYNIVVVNAGELNFGLIVDELLDSEEIVVKPLGRHLRGISTYAGATILGDGRAALILDVTGISSTMNLHVVKDRVHEQEIKERAAGVQDAQSLLLVRNAADEQFAIPLGLISRLEKIRRGDIERTSGRQTIKYRGGSLLLCSIEEVANVKPREDVEFPYVLIFPFAGKEVGIIVSEILDVVEYNMQIDEETFRGPGILGSAIIGDKTTLLLDLYGLVSAILPEWVEEKKEKQSVKQKDTATLLLVEDSKFFLNQVKGFTEDAGYNVLTALDGVLGLEVLNDPQYEVDLILTDIEMPNMDGIELTRQVRSHAKYSSIPILALTSVAAEEVQQNAEEAGVDEYLIKLDRERVLERIAYYLKQGRR